MSLQTWERIAEPYVHGYTARRGARVVEVIRHYSGDWHIYRLTVGGARVIDADAERSYPHHKRALADAWRWLREV